LESLLLTASAAPFSWAVSGVLQLPMRAEKRNPGSPHVCALGLPSA